VVGEFIAAEEPWVLLMLGFIGALSIWRVCCSEVRGSVLCLFGLKLIVSLIDFRRALTKYLPSPSPLRLQTSKSFTTRQPRFPHITYHPTRRATALSLRAESGTFNSTSPLFFNRIPWRGGVKRNITDQGPITNHNLRTRSQHGNTKWRNIYQRATSREGQSQKFFTF